jgi:DNA repair exonuclease SbcCD ATPase subunit
MIEFLEVEFDNFLSFHHGKLDLSQRGVVYVKGENLDTPNADSNDSGKSCSFDSITWALFEKLAKTGNKRVGDAVINTSAKKNCHVRLVWLQDGARYELDRYRKHAEHRDNVYLVGGDLISTGKRASTNEEIEKCLGMNYEMYLRSVLWAQGTSVRRLTQLTDGEYKQLFDEMIGTKHFNAKLEAIKQERLNRSNELGNLNYSLYGVEQRIGAKKEEIAKCGKQTSQSVVDEIRGLWEYYHQVQKRYSELSSPVSVLKAEIGHLASQKSEAERTLTSTKKLLQELDNSKKEDKCSQCGQVLASEVAKENIAKVRSTWLSTLKAGKIRFDALTKVHGDKTSELTRSLKQLEKEKEAYIVIMDRLQKKMEAIGITPDMRRFDAAEAEFEELARNQGRAEALQHEIEQLTEDAESLKNQSETARQDIAKLEKLEAAYGPQGARVLRLAEYTPHLNMRTREYSGLLSGGALEVEFVTTERLKNGELREKYGVRVKTKSGADFSLSGGGMTRRADLIAAFAVDDLRSSVTGKIINLKIYDEATDGLDASGEMCFVMLLRDECKGTSFFVSHKALVGDNAFDDVVLVRKKDNISEIAP